MMERLLLIALVLVQACNRASPAFVPLQHHPSLAATRRAFGFANKGMNAHPSGRHDAAPIITTTPDRPIVVIGAGGKTGRIIVQILAEQKQYVRAVTRTERTLENIPKESNQYVSYDVADVTSYDNILSTIAPGAAGVVWAATCTGVKKGGGDAFQVDYKGAYYTAKACLACNVPKLALISAACVTHPDALGSKAVNTLTQWTYGDTMTWIDAKVAGETAVRDLYKDMRKEKVDSKKQAYVIIRPAAALSNKPAIPVDELLVMQGDVYSSAKTISRTNVARLVVSALLKGKATDFVTFEVAPAVKLYKNDEGNFLDLLGLPTKKQTTTPDLPKALVHKKSSSYEELLDGLVADDDMLKKYASIVNDYKGGEGVPSVEDFA